MQYSERVKAALDDLSAVGALDPHDPRVVMGLALMNRGVHVVRLQARLDPQGTIAACVYKACGCPATLACAACAARKLVGRHWSEFAALRASDFLAELELPRVRFRNARLVCRAAAMAARQAAALQETAGPWRSLETEAGP